MDGIVLTHAGTLVPGSLPSFPTHLPFLQVTAHDGPFQIVSDLPECPECFGTGLKGGFQTPCSRGCKTT